MSDTKKPRARKENSDGTSGAAVTAPTESPSHRDQENADQPSQHGSEKPVAADAQHERQQDEQGGKDKQDGSVPKSTSDQKPEPAKGPSFKERGMYVFTGLQRSEVTTCRG